MLHHSGEPAGEGCGFQEGGSEGAAEEETPARGHRAAGTGHAGGGLLHIAGPTGVQSQVRPPQDIPPSLSMASLERKQLQIHSTCCYDVCIHS